jgi:hypothetical protein
MPENIKDILSHLSTDVDQETLLLYLQGKLSDEKRHEIEKHMMQGDFEDDALEGLQQVKDKQQIEYMVEMLNRDLRQKTAKKKARREKLKYKDQPWLYISVLIILLLIVVSYIVVRRMMHK